MPELRNTDQTKQDFSLKLQYQANKAKQPIQGYFSSKPTTSTETAKAKVKNSLKPEHGPNKLEANKCRN